MEIMLKTILSSLPRTVIIPCHCKKTSTDH